MKTCKTCGAAKALDEFYVSNRANCKVCVRARTRQHRWDKIDYYRAYDRERADLPHRVALRKEKCKATTEQRRRWAEKNRAKRQAHILVGNAVKSRRLDRPSSCERCHQPGRLHAHHEDYSKPDVVMWLCPPCHGKRHREINAERRSA